MFRFVFNFQFSDNFIMTQSCCVAAQHWNGKAEKEKCILHWIEFLWIFFFRKIRRKFIESFQWMNRIKANNYFIFIISLRTSLLYRSRWRKNVYFDLFKGRNPECLLSIWRKKHIPSLTYQVVARKKHPKLLIKIWNLK